jgi:hypothetical protein
MHRFVWNLHYPNPHVLEPTAPISVILHDTPMGPLGPAALPGRYTIKLTVDGQTHTQSLTVRMDPRERTSMSGLVQQFDLAKELVHDMNQTYAALQHAKTKGEEDALRRLDGELVHQYNSLYGASYGGTDDNPSTMAAPTSQQVSNVANFHHQVLALLGH